VSRLLIVTLWALLFISVGCSPARESFDHISKKLQGKTAREVEILLGKPDFRQKDLVGDERWIWWNYAVLDGNGYPPEIRGRVVHLEVTFSVFSSKPGGVVSPSKWRVREPFGVSYMLPQLRE
jgi:hypothetical protein